MSNLVDRKSVIGFLDSIELACVDRLDRETSSLGDFGLTTDQLLRVYNEVLLRSRGKLIHRYERIVGNLPCVCYQNTLRPRVGFVFLHGFDGSPYDYLAMVRSFYERMGDHIPCVWVFPAGPLKSRFSNSHFESGTPEESDLIIPAPPPPISTPTAAILDPSPSAAARMYVMSPLGGKSTDAALHDHLAEFGEENARRCNAIDPLAGYQWWTIPVLNLITGKEKSFKVFIQALKQNLRTPRMFFETRKRVIDTISSVCTSWSIPMSQVYIGGFSQGAMLASDLLITSARPFAGAILISGAPAGRADHKQVVRERKPRPESPNAIPPADTNDFSFRCSIPVYQAHGLKDPILPFPVGKFLRKHLLRMGFCNLTFNSFSAGHDVTRETTDKMLNWLSTTSPIKTLMASRSEAHLCPKVFAEELSPGSKLNRLKLRMKMSMRKRHRHTKSRQVSPVLDRLDSEQARRWPADDSDYATESCDSPVVANATEKSLRQEDEENPLDWSDFSVRVSRAIAELFLTLNTFEDLKVMPPSSADCVTQPGRLPSRRCRRTSLLDVQNLNTSDWSKINSDIRYALATDLESNVSAGLIGGSQSFGGSVEKYRLRGDFDFPLNRGGGSKTDVTTTSSSYICIPSERYEVEKQWSLGRLSSSSSIEMGRCVTTVAGETIASWCVGNSDVSDPDQETRSKSFVPRNALPKHQRAQEAKDKLKHPRAWRRAEKKPID